LREGTIGLAPLYAVLSFLRQEGEAYQMITTRAGEYAAQWTVDSMAPLRRSFVHASPRWLRGRLVLRLVTAIVRRSYGGSRVVAQMRAGAADVDLRASVFCTVREHVSQPLCWFYAAALSRLLTIFNLGGRVEVVACRGTGSPTCKLRVALLDGPLSRDGIRLDPDAAGQRDRVVKT
jgi:predicted hydrocarbon binding protein